MSNQTNQEKEENKINDSRISLGFWNNKGQINIKKTIATSFVSVAARGRVSTYRSIFTLRFFKHSVLLHSNEQETDRFLSEIGKWFKGEINQIIQGNFDFLNQLQFFRLSAITATTMTYVIYLFIKHVIEKSEIQSRLSSLGLNQYYLKKVNKGTLTYTFKLLRGKSMDFKTFEDTTGNLKQLFGYEQRKCERKNKREIVVMFNHKFPTQEDLKSLNVQDFQKKDYIFLGIGLPEIGEEIKEEDRVLGKYVRKYLKYSDLPQGIGNFGGAGFGKSNTLNQIFQGIFFNFDKVQSFTFCDFKQGIERQPYRDLEDKVKTGRIFTLDDDRLMLLNYLLKINIIIRARGEYLKNSGGKKKIIGKDVILFFDEMAEILDYEPRDKIEKEVQNQIYRLIESLLRIGRRGGMKLGYSTQSPLQNRSGLSTGMKNNTPLRITHGLTSTIQVSSVYEDFERWGINPIKYDIGKLRIVNMTNSTVTERRRLYVPEDFMEHIQFREYIEDDFDEEIKEYYKKVVEKEERKKALMNRNNDDEEKEEIFDMNEILDELLEGKLVNYEMYESGEREQVSYPNDNRVKKKKTKEELEYEKEFFDMVDDENKTEEEKIREIQLIKEMDEINLIDEPQKEINLEKESQNIKINTESIEEVEKAIEEKINLKDYENIDFEKNEEDFDKMEEILNSNLTNMKKVIQENYNKNMENKKNGVFESVEIDREILEKFENLTENEDLKLLDEL